MIRESSLGASFPALLQQQDERSKKYTRVSSPANLANHQRTKTLIKSRPSTSSSLQRKVSFDSQDRVALITTNPPSLCVHCSRRADVCMACSEILCNQKLRFQRQGSCYGAVAFFKKAVKESGQKQLVKRLVFQLWRNGFRIRRFRDKKLNETLEAKFRRSLLFSPFRCWRKFTSDSKLTRKDKKVDELTKRVSQLEDVVRKLNLMMESKSSR